VNATFDTSLIEGATTKERAIYVNEAQRDNYLVILTSPLSSSGKPIFFSETNAYIMHFLHNDALVVTMHIDCCWMSKILVDGGNIINILYGHALDWMEDAIELARKRIILRPSHFSLDFKE